MKKILIVDDEETIMRMYKLEFSRNGFEVNTAADGQEALDKARSMPDFILLDIMLPIIDGIAVFRELLQDVAIQKIPVGFVSALGKDIADFVGKDSEILQKAVFFLQKDKYTPQQIVDEVRKCLLTQVKV